MTYVIEQLEAINVMLADVVRDLERSSRECHRERDAAGELRYAIYSERTETARATIGNLVCEMHQDSTEAT